MKLLSVALAGFLAGVGLVSADDTKEEWRVAAEQLVINDGAPFMDAFSSTSLSFWVTVRDDGSSRDGLAEYVCLLIGDVVPDGQSVIVTIWDGIAMATNEMVRLGRATCPD